jgi:hypothetical protein
MTDVRSGEIVWRPDEQIEANANLTDFMARRGGRHRFALLARACPGSSDCCRSEGSWL